MSRSTEILRLIVRGTTDQARRALKQLGDQSRAIARRMESGFQRVQRTLFSLRGAIAALGVGALFRQVIRNTVEQERQLTQLEARLKSTGGQIGLTANQLVAMAEGLQKVTTFGDEAVISAQNILLTYTQIGRETFPRATEAVLDFATAVGVDVTSAAETVGRALGNPTRAMDALSRQGFVFTKEQQALIRHFEETGQLAEAQAIILGELEESYGGAARAARNTFGGALQGLRNAFGDLLEGKGGNLTEARDRVDELTKIISDPATVRGFNAITSLVLGLAGALASAAAGAVKLAEGIGIILARAVTGTDDPNDHLQTLQANIANTERRLRQLENLEASSRPGSRRREELRQERAELEQRLDTLRQTEELLRRDPTAFDMAPPRPEAAPDTPVGATTTAADLEAQEAAEKRAEEIAKLIEQLRVQADTEGFSAGQTALYHLEQLGATEADRERAQALIDVIEAKQADAKASEELRRAEEQAAREAEQYNEQLERFAEGMRQSLDPTRALRQEMELLEEVYRAGKLSAEEFAEAQQRLEKEIEAAGRQLSDLGEFGIQAARNMQTAFADFLFDLTQGTDNAFESMVRSFAQAMARMAAEAVAANILGAIGGGAGGGGGGFFANLFHDGGTAGEPGPRRRVSAAAFIGAPRFHNGGKALGLSSDEVPAILRRGERVLNVEETQAYERGGAQLAGVLGLEEGLVMKHLESPGFEELLVRRISRNPGKFRSALGSA